ncbi:MAG: zf-TFIIB domain-containing protein [Phenylobacterium sp.]|uniref:TFIIB-type zinc ribbon-containing protein n=1 Tax=Phenylobacterium sp. TaxID=1871053 RepID=UPI0025E60777|nr:zf-TFIIB domain-containing protein [Phenylobacterium sp.]MCA6223469.1 zf-TFIIB domain-containing protein [Phenylobacterium sp.]MCA6227234.1 zf-TFIIB domain-containing protein [Phenylobacterium sp.]MCA6233350.1 zf-TFIIB domain-containing protein [Phenylobacterium sp.]MCA6234905.1 zf-TFIIB domain-containing protein [Phenylobacterium sp.]MCA6248626.1 zf-TFIIB domain-containing protein [Phenylobacterium sp.]
MPLLLCPNCNDSMQTVARSGVELDMCPSCRGIWMDRGELEKVLGAVKSESEDQVRARQALEREADSFRRDPQEWVRRHPYDEGRRSYKWDDDDYYSKKKKKRFDIFDIFD